MSDIINSDVDRATQQAISENANTNEPLTAIATAASRGVGEIDLPDTGIDDEEEYVPRTLTDILHEAAGAGGMVRLSIKPELNFVLNIFADSVQAELETISNFEHEGQKLNIIQPLSKLNEKSKRVGALREPLKDFINVLSDVMSSNETIIVSPDAGVLVVDALVSEFTDLAANTLYSNFPVFEGIRAIPVPGEEGEEQLLMPATDFVRVTSLTEASQAEYSSETAISHVTVSVKFIVHLRVPLLLREESAKFEKTLKQHFKFLSGSGVKAGLPTTVYAGFSSTDVMTPSVVACLDWIREIDPSAQVLSFRNINEGGEFFGIPGFGEETYADALFNGGDFIVSFNLENEGE
jgi:hypothetical protein